MYVGQLKKSISEGFVTYILIRAGYKILCRNFRFKGGEIDIIVQKARKLVIVEVKCHKGEAIPFTNQQLIRILKGSRLFIFKHNIYALQIEIWGALCKIKKANLTVQFMRLR